MGIYGFGKAFNTRYVMGGQYSRRPHVNVRGGRPVMLGGSSFTKTTNVTINNGPTGFWGFMSGLFGGLFGGGLFGGLFGGGMGMGMGMSPFGMINQAQMPVQNQPKGDRLADLQKMFPDWVITSDGNGHYDAVNKDQTIHEEGNFDEMCDKLLKHKKEEPQGNTTPEVSTPATSTPATSTPATSTPATSTPATSTPATSTPATSTPATSTPATSTPATTAQQNEQQEIDKTKPIAVNIQFSIHSNSTNSGTATVKMPDDTIYIARTGMSLTHNRAMDALADDIRAQLKEAGWTNVTLQNTNFKFKQSEQVDGTTGAAVKATENRNQKTWTAEEKKKPITLNIRFAVHTLSGNSGTASVTTPDGEKFEVSTGMSLTHQRAMADLSRQMKAQLSQAGWTNVTLENKNFNWSD